MVEDVQNTFLLAHTSAAKSAHTRVPKPNYFLTIFFMNKILSNKEILSDKALYKKCVMYGKQALQAKRKFMGLLPEVCKRRLYEKKGFTSIFEFAAKLAGVSKEQVSNIINLERQFTDKSMLHKLLVNGEVSANKLIRIASIATNKNEKELAEKVKILPSRALEIWVKDVKNGQNRPNAKEVNGATDETKHAAMTFHNNSLQKPLFIDQDLHVQPDTQENLQEKAVSRIDRDLKLIRALSEETKQKLSELQEKGIDIDKLIWEMLTKREQEIEKEKRQLGEEEKQKLATTDSRLTKDKNPVKSSRYINVRIQKILWQEFGSKCAMPGCRRKKEEIHHQIPFAITRIHDPNNLIPLCRGHHLLEHLPNTT